MEEQLLVDAKTLGKMLMCSHNMAVKIGKAADAKVVFGRCVRWDVQKIKEYLGIGVNKK